MKKLIFLLLLLPAIVQAQTGIVQGREFRYNPKTAVTYAPYPGDSSVIMINRATGKFFRTHITGGGGGGTPGGGTTTHQYNNAGAFGGTNMTYNNATGQNILAGSSNTTHFIIRANATQSNANPLFKLQSSGGTDLLWMHSDNQVNTFIGVSSGSVNNFAGGGTDNTGVGLETLANNTTGSLNTAIGKRSLIMNVTGSGNSALGAGAAQKTTGSYNVAMGYHALLENTTASKNTAIGTVALVNKTGGDENTAVGYQASGAATGAYSNITAIGAYSLIQCVGNFNTALGSNTLYSNISGTNNTALGYAAGYNNLGSRNVFVGFFSGFNETGSDKLYIANSNTSTPLIGGDFSTGVVNIHSTSLYPFCLKDITATGVGGHIYGSSMRFSANRSVGGETTTAYITGALNDTSNAAYKSYLAFATTQVSDGTTERMRLTHDGNLLVGTTSNSGYRLDVIGPSKLTGALTHNTTNASDAAYATTTADYYIFLPDITANRVITLPSAASSTGRILKIWNKNSAAFTWSFNAAVKDASSADVTNLNNDTWYEITSDGTNWNLVTRNKSVFSTASTASLTVNVDDFETTVITALAANLTINAPTGTPINGQTTLLFRIKDNGTSRTLTFNAIFRAIGVTLPAATTIGKTMYIGAIWNGTDSKYDVVSVNEEL